MRINADFSRQIIVDSRNSDWVRSPESGVDRIMLDRIGDELARATSIVRYAPGSSFSRHEHAKGEEFLVLEGVFSDEDANYPTGTYVRNPPGSGHAPFSEDGCRILVKLRQFAPDDLTRIVINTSTSNSWLQTDADCIESLLLHRHGAEQVHMLRVAAGASVNLPTDGAEVLVVSGSVNFDDQALPRESWLRVPEGRSMVIGAVADSVLWLKQGHLPK
jgi:anti-sigma factor ChrR (cupin superfamily)